MSYQPLGIEYDTFNNDRRPMVNICCTNKFNYFVNRVLGYKLNHTPTKFKNGISIIPGDINYKEKTMVISYHNINVFNIENGIIIKNDIIIENGTYCYFMEDIKSETFIMIVEFLAKKDYITINFDK